MNFRRWLDGRRCVAAHERGGQTAIDDQSAAVVCREHFFFARVRLTDNVSYFVVARRALIIAGLDDLNRSSESVVLRGRCVRCTDARLRHVDCPCERAVESARRDGLL